MAVEECDHKLEGKGYSTNSSNPGALSVCLDENQKEKMIDAAIT